MHKIYKFQKMVRYAIFNCLAALILLSSCTANARAPHDFEYRGIYSPTNAKREIREKYHTNHVDFDWDLWGHNLKKVVGKDAPEEVYATVDGKREKKQFCFSSDKLYSLIETYILDQFGEGNDKFSARICIMPQDNKVACLCERCRIAGNTPGNATPAVSEMLCKLAYRFPLHRFFTSSYHTTRQAPSQALPKNVGVLISAIDLQMRVDFTQTQGYPKFLKLLEEWGEKAKTIYIWDYERNYEDYLTPFPCLYAIQERLKLYRQKGVDGVFFNGSGDEFSTFDDMQTVVLAQLLENPETDVEKAVEQYFKTYYPVTAKLLTDYYMGLEKRARQTNHLLPLYGSMQEMCEAYLDAREFTQWRAELDKLSKKTERPERERLNYLLTALAYTQLQLLYLPGTEHNVALEEDMLEVLKGHQELKGMKYYSEAYGEIDEFIQAHQK